MEPDVIMSCITPSFGGGIPYESGPRRRAGEMPSCIPAALYSGGDGVNLDMAGMQVSWNIGDDAAGE
jgi:hypothetical protein